MNFQQYALPAIFVAAPFIYVWLFAQHLANSRAGTDADIGLVFLGANLSGFVLLGAVIIIAPFVVASLVALRLWRRGNHHAAQMIYLVMLGLLMILLGWASFSEPLNMPFAIVTGIALILTILADHSRKLSSVQDKSA